MTIPAPSKTTRLYGDGEQTVASATGQTQREETAAEMIRISAAGAVPVRSKLPKTLALRLISRQPELTFQVQSRRPLDAHFRLEPQHFGNSRILWTTSNCSF